MRIITILWMIVLGFGGCDTFTNSKEAYRPKGVEKEYKSYVFGINAFLDAKEMFIAYCPILNYLEENIEGVKFDLVTSKDFVEHEKYIRKYESFLGPIQ